jgi:phosphoenolpyruvate carboxykinase (GTP)
MLPFCGYHMGDYFRHWIEMGTRSEPSKLPRIYYVNWFKKGNKGEYLWPGYGENSRILKWIFERVVGTDGAISTPIGNLPKPGSLDLAELNMSTEAYQALFKVDKRDWLGEVDELRQYFKIFGSKLPPQILEEIDKLESRLNNVDV